MAREYSFSTPLNVPGFYVGTAIQKMQSAEAWDYLPEELRRRCTDACASWNSVVVTQEELDAIPDDDWEKIKTALEL